MPPPNRYLVKSTTTLRTAWEIRMMMMMIIASFILHVIQEKRRSIISLTEVITIRRGFWRKFSAVTRINHIKQGCYYGTGANHVLCGVMWQVLTPCPGNYVTHASLCEFPIFRSKLRSLRTNTTASLPLEYTCTYHNRHHHFLLLFSLSFSCFSHMSWYPVPFFRSSYASLLGGGTHTFAMGYDIPFKTFFYFVLFSHIPRPPEMRSSPFRSSDSKNTFRQKKKT